MNAIKILNEKKATHDEWKSVRKISGSVIGSILGLNPYCSAYEAWGRLIELLPEPEENMSMKMGKKLEPIVAELYAEETGHKVRRDNFVRQHPDYDWATGTFDRIIIDKTNGNGILECKTASEYSNSDWSNNIVPPHYMVQLQWYFFITGYKWGAFAALVGGNKFYHIHVDRDDTMIESLFHASQDFWFNHVLTGIPPEPDASKSCANALAHLYSEPKVESEIELETDAELWAQQYKEADREIKAAQERKELAANMLKAMLAENEIGIRNGQKVVTWKLGKRGRTFRVVGGVE